MTCIKRRMLYACSQSYDPDAAPEAGRAVDWVGRPEKVARNAAHWKGAKEPIDLALVGRIPEGVLVAFRGTLPPFTRDQYDSPLVILDWLNDAEFLCKTIAPYPGKVHEGFATSTNNLWGGGAQDPGLEARVDRLLRDGGPRQLFVTGHSKGGALANLFAWRAFGKREWSDVPIRVYTVAAAHAGNEEFGDAYDKSDIVCRRYEYALDAVPFMPLGARTPGWARALMRKWFVLEEQNYAAVGTRVPAKLTWADWTKAWGRHFASLLRKGGFKGYLPAVIEAHSIAAGKGYDALICLGEQGCGPDHRLDPVTLARAA